MPTIPDRVIILLKKKPGLSDREITNIILGHNANQQYVNQTCRSLEVRGVISRRKRPDSRIGNYLSNLKPESSSQLSSIPSVQERDPLSEDEIKRSLQAWLDLQGWSVEIAYGKSRGADVVACRGKERWIIEVKGRGSRPQMKINYFLAVLGEILQRMNELNSKYSIVLPDLKQFRNLWNKLPELAKSRIGITALFVDEFGNVKIVD